MATKYALSYSSPRFETGISADPRVPGMVDTKPNVTRLSLSASGCSSFRDARRRTQVTEKSSTLNEKLQSIQLTCDVLWALFLDFPAKAQADASEKMAKRCKIKMLKVISELDAQERLSGSSAEQNLLISLLSVRTFTLVKCWDAVLKSNRSNDYWLDELEVNRVLNLYVPASDYELKRMKNKIHSDIALLAIVSILCFEKYSIGETVSAIECIEKSLKGKLFIRGDDDCQLETCASHLVLNRVSKVVYRPNCLPVNAWYLPLRPVLESILSQDCDEGLRASIIDDLLSQDQ